MVKSGQLQPKQLTAALDSLRALQLDWKTHIIRILAVKRDRENAYCRCHISSKPQLMGASRATQEKQYQCPSLKGFMKNGTFFCYFKCYYWQIWQKNIIHKPLPGNSDLKDLLWTAEVVQKCRGDPKPKSWSTCTREVFQDWNTVLLWRACHNGNAIRNNQLAKQMRKVTPCTTEVKTWLPAVRYGAHLLLLQHGLRGNQGPCNYRCIETISPRSCGVNFWGWWERTP